MRVLLITHETSRTGAPRVATVVARGLVQGGHDVHIVARSNGALLRDFESIAPTSLEFLYRVRRKIRSVRYAGVLAFLLDTAQAFGAILRWRPELVYVNSSAATIYLRPARWLRRRVVLHVHESGLNSSKFLARAHLSSIPGGVEIIACSPSVKSDIIALMPWIAQESIHMVASVPDDAMVVQMSAQRPEWDIAPDELVVGCCGAVEHRKGTDLWLEVAKLVLEEFPGENVRFVWIGEGHPPAGSEQPGVQFLGPRNNPYPYIKRFDIFTLPSRDDPFPLVVLEAMLLGKPTVAFDVGGVGEQIGTAGIIVPPGDVNAFALAVIELLRSYPRRAMIGRHAIRRAEEQFSTKAFMASVDRIVEPKI